jgi:hypothetical protein
MSNAAGPERPSQTWWTGKLTSLHTKSCNENEDLLLLCATRLGARRLLQLGLATIST